MSQPGSENRLIELQRSWRENPDSNIYLELAEELRRHGRSAEAIQALEQGLHKNPGDLNALVALGRCRLEARQLGEAVQALQVVLSREAGHLIANKLLVEAYLENGQADNARERLDSYRRLNPNDPEIQRLETRLQQISQPVPQPITPAAPAPGGDIFSLAPPPAPAAPSGGGADLFSLAPPPAPSAESADLFALAPPPAAAPIPEAPAPIPEAPAPILEAPAPVLEAAPAPISEVPAPVLEAPAPVVEAPAPVPEAAPVPVPEASDLAPIPVPIPETPAAESAAPDPASVFEDVAPADPTFEVGASASFEAEPMIESPVQEPAFVEPAFEPEAAPEAAVESPSPPVAEAASSEDDGSPATATLGELYLRQGHYEEAGKIFRQVLARDPENAAAAAGLAKIEDREARKSAPPSGEITAETEAVTAEELLAQYASPASLRGLTAKKIVVLDSYLKHLRRNG